MELSGRCLCTNIDHSLIMAIALMVASRETEPSWSQAVGGMDCRGFFSMDNSCSHRHALTPAVKQCRTSLDFQVRSDRDFVLIRVAHKCSLVAHPGLKK